MDVLGVDVGPAECAVVIAAGAGNRWRASNGDCSLKLFALARGVPLIVRTLRTLLEEGTGEAIVVTGYRADEVQSRLGADDRLRHLRLRFVHNPEWARSNGLSVLAAREAVGGRRFLLSMGDHVYSPRVVRAAHGSSPGRGLVLAVDRQTGNINDPDDAMWVRLDDDARLTHIGKDLVRYDAVDTGVFHCSSALFDALEAERGERGGDCALADGVRRLAREGLARAVDITGAWWQDVDTVSDLAALEVKLGASANAP